MRGGALELKDHGSYIEFIPKATVGQWEILGTPILDIRNQKIRSLRCPDKSLHIYNDQNSVLIKSTYSLNSCTNVENTGVSLLATKDKDKNHDFLKTISVSENLEIEDRGTHIHISAKNLTARIETLQQMIEDLKSTVERLVKIEDVVGKLQI